MRTTVIIELRPSAGAWRAQANGGLRASGDTAEDVVVLMKRASLVRLVEAGEVDYGIEWSIVARKGVPARDKRLISKVARAQSVELSADIAVKEAHAGWKWRSDGGAVSGTSPTLPCAYDDAARAAWQALAEHLDDEDLARAGAVHLDFVVTTTSAWVVDHLAPDVMRGGYAFRAPFAALKKALGAPLFNPFDGEPLYGWGLRGRGGNTAWIGMRIRDAEDDVTEKDAASFAKGLDEWELAATNERAAKSVIAWLHKRTATAT